MHYNFVSLKRLYGSLKVRVKFGKSCVIARYLTWPHRPHHLGSCVIRVESHRSSHSPRLILPCSCADSSQQIATLRLISGRAHWRMVDLVYRCNMRSVSPCDWAQFRARSESNWRAVFFVVEEVDIVRQLSQSMKTATALGMTKCNPLIDWVKFLFPRWVWLSSYSLLRQTHSTNDARRRCMTPACI